MLQSALKRQQEENKSETASMFSFFCLSASLPCYRGTVIRTNHVWQCCVSGCCHQIKTIALMERGQNALTVWWLTWGPSWYGGWLSSISSALFQLDSLQQQKKNHRSGSVFHTWDGKITCFLSRCREESSVCNSVVNKYVLKTMELNIAKGILNSLASTSTKLTVDQFVIYLAGICW